jgi:hypothetical protein
MQARILVIFYCTGAKYKKTVSIKFTGFCINLHDEKAELAGVIRLAH